MRRRILLITVLMVLSTTSYAVQMTPELQKLQDLQDYSQQLMNNHFHQNRLNLNTSILLKKESYRDNIFFSFYDNLTGLHFSGEVKKKERLYSDYTLEFQGGTTEGEFKATLSPEMVRDGFELNGTYKEYLSNKNHYVWAHCEYLNNGNILSCHDKNEKSFK